MVSCHIHIHIEILATCLDKSWKCLLDYPNKLLQVSLMYRLFPRFRPTAEYSRLCTCIEYPDPYTFSMLSFHFGRKRNFFRVMWNLMRYFKVNVKMWLKTDGVEYHFTWFCFIVTNFCQVYSSKMYFSITV
jgi:hypothetical protein